MKNSPSGTSRLAGAIALVASPRLIASAAMTRSRNGAGASSMRPWDSIAAASEPAATPTAKMRLIAISTSRPPPMRDFMMTGTRDSVTMPTVQNQLVASAATHCRSSARSSPMIRHVEAMTFLWTLSPGAPTPVGGIKRAEA